MLNDTSSRGKTSVQVRTDFTVKPGETLELGDIRIDKPEARPGRGRGAGIAFPLWLDVNAWWDKILHSMIRCKGYVGVMEVDPDANLIHGDVIGLRDVITFQGQSVPEAMQAFRESVDDYQSSGTAKTGAAARKPRRRTKP
jgi:hypothetical protein